MFCTQHDPAFSESDALQILCVRLLGVLRQQKCSFSSARHFLAVAGKHLRWAALELLRKPPLRHLESVAGPPGQDSASRSYEPAASTSSSPDRLSAWQRFHELVDRDGVLEPEEREVLTLRWYHGLEQEEIAQAMGVSERTVKRYWKSAKEKLAKHIRLDDLL
jgi:RNA polymerase sigma factor (sigma-70 family)